MKTNPPEDQPGETMGAHCFDCKESFHIPRSPKSPLKCPACGSGQVIDHNLAPLSPEEERAALTLFLSRN
jgi:hypothetical protein